MPGAHDASPAGAPDFTPAGPRGARWGGHAGFRGAPTGSGGPTDSPDGAHAGFPWGTISGGPLPTLLRRGPTIIRGPTPPAGAADDADFPRRGGPTRISLSHGFRINAISVGAHGREGPRDSGNPRGRAGPTDSPAGAGSAAGGGGAGPAGFPAGPVIFPGGPTDFRAGPRRFPPVKFTSFGTTDFPWGPRGFPGRAHDSGGAHAIIWAHGRPRGAHGWGGTHAPRGLISHFRDLLRPTSCRARMVVPRDFR